MSDTWYTWLEQGRDIHASASSLDSVARALCMDEYARQYIRYLAGIPVAESECEDFEVDGHIKALVTEMRPHAACVTTGAYDLLAWNRTFELIWLTPGHPQPLGRNVLWYMLTDPVLQDRFERWSDEVAGMVARFRFESSKHPSDRRFAQLIEAFLGASALFGELWSKPKVQPMPTHGGAVVHPIVGPLRFRRVQLRIVDQPGLTLTVQRAEDEGTVEALNRLLESDVPVDAIPEGTAKN